MVVPGELDGAVAAEVHAGGAEGAGAQVEGAGDFVVSLGGLLDHMGNGVAGADPLAHHAVDALVRVEDDAAAVVGRALLGLIGDVHIAAGLGKELRKRFFDERKIHYFFIPFLFSCRIWVARYRPSITASGLGVQPATSTSTWTYLERGPATE